MTSQFSASLKSLLKAPHARGSAVPAPSRAKLDALFDAISSSARKHGVGEPAWLTLSTATIVTLNSPATLGALYHYVTRSLGTDAKQKAQRAALMREVGLKCISFSGIPRTINSLGALRAELDDQVYANLSTSPTRKLDTSNVKETVDDRSLALWSSIYSSVSSRLLDKLAESHPDLPVHILSSHYGSLLSDPFDEAPAGHAKCGRLLTSVVAVSCLRAQQGVAPQVTSHILGLKRAATTSSGATTKEVDGQDFLVSDEGCEWVLNQVDSIVQCLTDGNGSFGISGTSETRHSKL